MGPNEANHQLYKNLPNIPKVTPPRFASIPTSSIRAFQVLHSHPRRRLRSSVCLNFRCSRATLSNLVATSPMGLCEFKLIQVK